ncbi:MAG: RnfABCDGE type electron transport complex subunit G [Paludibacteraceae bacterium]|nr:RnfABCDGE type electron transport complex subunit G [Paludibacteraceae bacterium]MBQ4017833.1 RnfABCDGE type electron transport complex subunit G [Paludibacteraceae bacterium]
MEKLKSSLPNMMLSLVLICLVAAGALAGVYLLTAETIAQQEADKQKAAVFSVLPNNGEGAVIKDTIETENGLTVYRAYIDSTFIGAAVKTKAMGFGGNQEIMVGFDAEDVIVNYQVLKHQETPGLGDHIKDWFNDKTQAGRCILGRKANGKFAVTKKASTSNEEVEAITAATISSRAFLNAINEAYAAVHAGEEGVEAVTSASQLHQEEAPAVEAATGATEQMPDSLVQCKGEGHCPGHCAGHCNGEGKCQGHCKHHQENQPTVEKEEAK